MTETIAALVIAAVAVKEGRDAWRGGTCCPPAPTVILTGTDEAACIDDCCARTEATP